MVPPDLLSSAAAAPLPLDAVPVPLACFDLGDEPRLLAANGLFQRAFGLEARQRPSLSGWLERTYPQPDYRQRVLAQWHAAVLQAREGEEASLQCRLLNAAGEQRELQLQFSCPGDRLVVACLDVSARSRAEAQLEEARASLAQTALALTEAIPVGTYTMVMPPDRPVAYFSFLSERFLQITGLERVRARENPLEGFACVHPDDYDDWLRINAEAFASRRPFKGECRVVVEGETRWISAESVPRDLPDGSTVWEGVVIDISERVQAQQQLQASERRLQRLLDNLPIPLATRASGGEEGEFFCNLRFIETFGYAAADLNDLDGWMQRAYPDPGYRASVMACWEQALARIDAHGAAVSVGEVRLRCADGRELEVLISATRVDDLTVASLVDISERKRQERELRQVRLRERRLEEQQRQRLEQKLRTSLAAAAVAHEIYQPLSTILLQAKLARRRLGSGGAPERSDADPTATLDQLVAEAERVVRVMEKMRSLLRNVQSQPSSVDLANVVDSALLFLRPRLEQAGVRLDSRGLDQPCPIAGDADQLQVAVSNLLRNSLEALATLPPGRRHLALTLERDQHSVRLSIADSGPGFQAGVLQALPLATTKPDGTGLGLFMVRTTAENHGGSLAFGRSPLGGALVSLTLPLAGAPDPPPLPGPPATALPPPGSAVQVDVGPGCLITPASLAVEAFLAAAGPILDVRSPAEHARGHLPGAISVPLFSDAERAEIGTLYKQRGRLEAVWRGLALVGPRLDTLAGQLLAQASTAGPLRLHCWRGGMRSESVAWLAGRLDQPVLLLDGGYKSFRRWALELFERPWPIRLLGGRTGCGKTELLLALRERGVAVIDLEGLAHHRGSSFGGLGQPPQPSGEQFENSLAMALRQVRGAREIWLEAESSQVGRCRIPAALWRQMQLAPVLEVRRPLEQRLAHLVNLYGVQDPDALAEATRRISRRLGPQRTAAALEAIGRHDWAAACLQMLDYYDRCYDHELRAHAVDPVDLGDLSPEAAAAELLRLELVRPA